MCVKFLFVLFSFSTYVGFMRVWLHELISCSDTVGKSIDCKTQPERNLRLYKSNPPFVRAFETFSVPNVRGCIREKSRRKIEWIFNSHKHQIHCIREQSELLACSIFERETFYHLTLIMITMFRYCACGKALMKQRCDHEYVHFDEELLPCNGWERSHERV